MSNCRMMSFGNDRRSVQDKLKDEYPSLGKKVENDDNESGSESVPSVDTNVEDSAAKPSHCTAVVKMLPDYTDLFISHTGWFE